jgi:hypothetical protein
MSSDWKTIFIYPILLSPFVITLNVPSTICKGLLIREILFLTKNIELTLSPEEKAFFVQSRLQTFVNLLYC